MQTDQHDYWDTVAPSKTFSHPLDTAWIAQYFSPDMNLLDFGCGYGRSLKELHRLGFSQLTGIDYSEEMLIRGRKNLPQAQLIHNQGTMIPLPDHSQQGILLMAVLTCIPSDSDQQNLVNEFRRVLRPGGLIYLSDNLLNEDARNQDRYRAQQLAGDYPFGVFKLSEGVLCRHHPDGYFEALFSEFTPLASRDFVVTTMNGNKARARQMILMAD